jgi:hypothetical protein
VSKTAYAENVPESAKDDFDDRTPSESGFDDGFDGFPYGSSVGNYWSEKDYESYYEAYQRGLQVADDMRTLGDWDDD